MTITQNYRISAVGRKNPFFFGDQIQLQWGSSTPWTDKPPAIGIIIDQQLPKLMTDVDYRPEVRLIHAQLWLDGKEYKISMAEVLQAKGFCLVGAVSQGLNRDEPSQGNDEVYAAEEVGP